MPPGFREAATLSPREPNRTAGGEEADGCEDADDDAVAGAEGLAGGGDRRGEGGQHHAAKDRQARQQHPGDQRSRLCVGFAAAARGQQPNERDQGDDPAQYAPGLRDDVAERDRPDDGSGNRGNGGGEVEECLQADKSKR